VYFGNYAKNHLPQVQAIASSLQKLQLCWRKYAIKRLLNERSHINKQRHLR